MNPTCRNVSRAVALFALAGVALYETHALSDQQEQVAASRKKVVALGLEAAALRAAEAAGRSELADAERQLAALPPPATPMPKVDSAQLAARQAWLERVKLLKQKFAEDPARRIPEMRYLQEVDWLAPAQFPLEDETQLRMALAKVREAARVRFRPLMSGALLKLEAAGATNVADTPLMLAPYFDPPVDRALLEQYEFTNRIVTKGGVPTPVVSYRPKAPVDDLFEFRSTMDSRQGGIGGGGNPTAWMADFFSRQQRAIQAFRAAQPGVPIPSLRGLAPYFDEPLPAAVLDAYDVFAREMTRPR